MALDKTALAQKFKAILDAESDNVPATAAARQRIADGFADAVHDYVTAAGIQYDGGLTAPNGPVTGVFNGQLQ